MKTYFLTILVGAVLFISHSIRAQDKFEVKASHPRIILSKEAELSLRFLFLENDDANEIQMSLKKSANKLVNNSFELADSKGNITLERSNEVLLNVITLGMAYRIFEDDKYEARIVEALVSICQLPDWTKYDYLTMSNFITISAIGYDWLYYDLKYEERGLIRNSIVQKGLNPGLKIMENMDQEENWIKNNPQHELTFSNALVLGSLSIADDFPDLNKKVVYRYLINNQKKLESLQFDDFRVSHDKDWQREVRFLAKGLASIKYSLGHDFNISNLPNIKAFSQDYIAYTQKEDIDSEDLSVLDPSFLWFGKLNDQNEANDFYISNVKKYHLEAEESARLNYICLLWMI